MADDWRSYWMVCRSVERVRKKGISQTITSQGLTHTGRMYLPDRLSSVKLSFTLDGLLHFSQLLEKVKKNKPKKYEAHTH